MIYRFSLLQAPFGLLVFLILLHPIPARVPIEPLSEDQLFNSFNLYPINGPGGCGRYAPNGVPMMPFVLKSLGGANAIVQTVLQDLPTYPTQIYVRGLLFLFFGITFLADHQINPIAREGNENAYNNILHYFTAVRQVFVSPQNRKPRYRCLEDYASYYQHNVGPDGREDPSAPLIAELLNAKMSNGQYYPGLMFVNNRVDGTTGWYKPDETNPSGGGCQQITTRFASCSAHLNTTTMDALYGITACPIGFDLNPLLDLGTPAANGGLPEIRKFLDTSDVVDLHELMHIVSLNFITDTPGVYPPDDNWESRAWRQWGHKRKSYQLAYGYKSSAYLGLVRPGLARRNADNYATFAGCMYFTELDCLGDFQDSIKTKRDLPFQTSLSHKAIKKIRAGSFDLTKDLPMDINLEQKPEGRRTTKDDNREFGLSVNPLGDAKRRIAGSEDIDAPTVIFG